jgi:hypothetical protein
VKAILVLEMPENCLECPFRYKSEEMFLGNFTYQSLFRCKFEPEGLCEDDGDTVYLNDIMMKSKPDWCPLKPMPEKIQVCGKYPQPDGIVPSCKIGYNACIDEILGDKE